MKKILLCLFSLLVLDKAVNAQTTIAGGQVYGTWTLAGSPYNVTGSIQIPNDSTLTIAPGVTVSFQGTFKLAVFGRLIAIGTAADSITFTSANTTNGWRGIRFPNTSASNDSSKISYCKLLYGKATGSSPDNNGGAIYSDSYSKIVISHNRISNCSANNNGGGIYIYSCAPKILNNIISYNSSLAFASPTSGGGGIYSYIASGPYPQITGNVISNNNTSSYGGGIFCRQSAPTISNNVITNNNATADGGGIFCNGSFGPNPSIINCTISNNSANNGGGLACSSDTDPTLRNSILWGNTAATAGPQVYLSDDPSDPNFYYCDVQGGSGAIDANGNFFMGTYSNNLNSDPLFVSPSGGSGTGFNGVAANWSLQASSPVIDAGDPTMITQSTDVAGNPRINICRIDMGAFEYQSGLPFAVSITQTATIPCNGYTTGELVATGSGSGAPYTYSWSPGGSANDTITSLGAGTYTVTATNSSGCVRTKSFTITQPAGMTLTSSQTDISCNGNCNGSASVSVNGGTSPFDYLWDTSPNQTTAGTTATLCSGPYSVTVTDAGGCTKTTSVTITTPGSLSFTATHTNVSCNAGNNGSITIDASGGTAPLSYSIDGGINYLLSDVFTGLAQGTYSVVTKDANGCQTSTSTLTIDEPAPLAISTTHTNVNCFGAGDGTATAVVSGGTWPYSYAWNSSPAQTTATASNLSIGNYSVTVTDSNNCTINDNAIVAFNISTVNLCLVTVDTLSLHNNIIWEKPVVSNIDSFKIYRVKTFTLDTLIATLPYSALSEYTDTTANPNITQYDYKMSTVDTCGNEGPKSPAHRTIHMLTNLGMNQVNLQWNFYVGNNVDYYVVLRDSTMSGAWQQIATLSPASSSYSDNNLPGTGAWRYRVDVVWTTACTPTARTMASTVNTTRSNTKDNYRITALNYIDASQVQLFPNPSTESITLTLNANAFIKNINVTDATGRLVNVNLTNFNSNQVNININDLAKGIYFMEVNTNTGLVRKSFVKN